MNLAHRSSVGPGVTGDLQQDLDALELGPCMASTVIWSGPRSTVLRLTMPCGEDLVVKRFTAAASARHARRHGTPLARFEFERNVSLHALPGLEKRIAAPVAWAVVGGRHLFAQQFVQGSLLDHFAATAPRTERLAVVADLERIVDAAHRADIFDLDLHTRNVMVSRGASGVPHVALFDFSKIPYHVRPPNPLAGLLVTLGVIGPQQRDRRCLRRVHREVAWARPWIPLLYLAHGQHWVVEMEPLLAGL